jgi:hypothetical protein
MVKGFVVNNTGRSRHIFKRTVYPGQKIDLDYVYKLVGNKVPEGSKFEDWLQEYLPQGWELDVVPAEVAQAVGGRRYKETLTAEPTVVSGTSDEPEAFETDAEDKAPSKEFTTPKAISKMTAKDIYELRLKDNPKRILQNVNSIHKLRRALTMCKNDKRKAVLLRLIQGRIRQLNVTL